MLAENGREDEARAIFKALSQENCAFATHALGCLAQRAGEEDAVANYFVLAYEQAGDKTDASFAEDALSALVASRDYEAAWKLYNGLPLAQRTPMMELIVAKAAAALEEYEFLEKAFATEYACIREGAAGLADVWFEVQSRRKCRAQGIPFTSEQIDTTLPLPRNLDFRMFKAD